MKERGLLRERFTREFWALLLFSIKAQANVCPYNPSQAKRGSRWHLNLTWIPWSWGVNDSHFKSLKMRELKLAQLAPNQEELLWQWQGPLKLGSAEMHFNPLAELGRWGCSQSFILFTYIYPLLNSPSTVWPCHPRKVRCADLTILWVLSDPLKVELGAGKVFNLSEVLSFGILLGGIFNNRGRVFV